MNEITVRVTKNYGVEAIYPANANAEIFASMLNQKTLRRRDIENIKKLGYTVNVEAPTL
jgi:hypothetical protein